MTELNKKGDSLKKGTGPFFDQKRSQSPQTSFSEEENILRRIPLEITALSVLAALVAVPLFDPLTGLLVLAGGALAALNFLWLRKTISRALSSRKNGDRPHFLKNKKKEPGPIFSKRALLATIGFLAGRVVLILGIFFIIIYFFSNRVIAFAAGFSTMIPVFLIEAAIALTRMKQWKS